MSRKSSRRPALRDCIDVQFAQAQLIEAEAIARHDFLWNLKKRRPDLVVKRDDGKLALKELRCGRMVAPVGRIYKTLDVARDVLAQVDEESHFGAGGLSGAED
jgi:hypothetical protein